MPNDNPTTTDAELNAVEAGIEAACDAVSELAIEYRAWGPKEHMIAQTAARAAVATLIMRRVKP